MKFSTPFDKKRYLDKLSKEPSISKATYQFYQVATNNADLSGEEYKVMGTDVETLSSELDEYERKVCDLPIKIGSNNLKTIKPYLTKVNQICQERVKVPYTLVNTKTNKAFSWSRLQLQKAIKLYWNKFDQEHYCFSNQEAIAIDKDLQKIKKAQKKNDYVTILKAYKNGAKRYQNYVKDPKNHNMEKTTAYYIQNGYKVLQSLHTNQADMKYAQKNGLYALYKVNYHKKTNHVTLASVSDLINRLDSMISDIEIQQRYIITTKEIEEGRDK